MFKNEKQNENTNIIQVMFFNHLLKHKISIHNPILEQNVSDFLLLIHLKTQFTN